MNSNRTEENVRFGDSQRVSSDPHGGSSRRPCVRSCKTMERRHGFSFTIRSEFSKSGEGLLSNIVRHTPLLSLAKPFLDFVIVVELENFGNEWRRKDPAFSFSSDRFKG